MAQATMRSDPSSQPTWNPTTESSLVCMRHLVGSDIEITLKRPAEMDLDDLVVTAGACSLYREAKVGSHSSS
jgi:hypothetical protein